MNLPTDYLLLSYRIIFMYVNNILTQTKQRNYMKLKQHKLAVISAKHTFAFRRPYRWDLISLSVSVLRTETIS